MTGDPTASEQGVAWLEQLISTIPAVRIRPRAPSSPPTTLPLALNEDSPVETAQELVALVGETRQLVFFDGDHPQVSDPGLYVMFQRSGDHLHAKGANHGWSYPWTPLDDDAAADWLWLSRTWNTGAGGAEQSTMRFSNVPRVDRSKDGNAERFRTWLAERLGRPLVRLEP